jgi:hypothetical protein
MYVLDHQSQGSSDGIAMGYGMYSRDSISGRGKKIVSTPMVKLIPTPHKSS